MAGRTALVTGASSGIGEATALLLARRGASVLLVARRAEELDRVANVVRAAGGVAHVHPCDLADADAVEALADDVLARHGHVDLLVNNAGRSIRRSLRYSWDRPHDFERTMALNYFGPVRLMLRLLPVMAERGEGHVVNVLTWGVQVRAPKFAAYIASKSALDSFGRIAARELRGNGVRVTNVRFGLVRTPMIGPTEAYARLPARSPEQAAAVIVRAVDTGRPTVSNAAGIGAEVLNLVAPRFADWLFWRLDRLVPDSAAARGEAGRGPGR